MELTQQKVTKICLELSDLRIWQLQKDAGTAYGLNENTNTCKSFQNCNLILLFFINNLVAQFFSSFASQTLKKV